MYENNIKFVQFTATPENINAKYEATMKEAHAIATMDVPDQYLSIEKLEKQGRIFSAKDLCGELPLKEEDKPSHKERENDIRSLLSAKSFVSNVPTYWGSQPILEAPAYVGATVIFMAF